MAFKPDQPPATSGPLGAVVAWAMRQFQRVGDLWADDVESVTMRVLMAAPARTKKGMYVTVGATLGGSAPFGSGEGLYRRNEANNAWVFVG